LVSANQSFRLNRQLRRLSEQRMQPQIGVGKGSGHATHHLRRGIQQRGEKVEIFGAGIPGPQAVPPYGCFAAGSAGPGGLFGVVSIGGEKGGSERG